MDQHQPSPASVQPVTQDQRTEQLEQPESTTNQDHVEPPAQNTDLLDTINSAERVPNGQRSAGHPGFPDYKEAMRILVCAQIERFKAMKSGKSLSLSKSRVYFNGDGSPAAFLSLDEFMRFPESHSRALLQAYKDLIRVPEEVSINQTAGFRSSQMSLNKPGSGGSRGITDSWVTMTPYWRWIAEVYHEEMVKKFGGLAAVDREFMPFGGCRDTERGQVQMAGLICTLYPFVFNSFFMVISHHHPSSL